MGHWPFADPPNVAVFTTGDIVFNGKPILYVSHDYDDGAWQFHYNLVGATEQNAKIVSLSSIVEMDHSIKELSDLPYGWIARRKSIESPWIRTQKVRKYRLIRRSRN